MQITQKFLNATEKAQNIVITTHLFPDADGIGSQISLCLALREKGKNVICCNQEELLSRYKYLDSDDVIIGIERIKERTQEKIDLIIVVDTNIIERAGDKLTALRLAEDCPVLYIDHHPSEYINLETHCIDTTAAATGQMIGELIQEIGIEFTPKIALPLYTAILIDTSSFRYPTVSAKTHSLVAKLMETGIEPPSAYNGIYGAKKIEHMHLLGKVLSTANSTKSEEIAWIVLPKELIDSLSVDIEDTHSFINNLLILNNVKVACMFRDDGDKLKVSFRSTGEFDVGSIAIALGGGGHTHSAATIISKAPSDDLNTIVDSVIARIEKAMD